MQPIEESPYQHGDYIMARKKTGAEMLAKWQDGKTGIDSTLTIDLDKLTPECLTIVEMALRVSNLNKSADKIVEYKENDPELIINSLT